MEQPRTLDEITAVVWGIGVDSNTRLGVLLQLTRDAPASLFWEAFHKHWSSCDNTWSYREELLSQLRRFNSEELGVGYLRDEDRAILDSLTDPFTAYRGCSRERAAGVSWTVDPEVAEGFARGHRGIQVPNPVVAIARVPKRAVFATYTERNESEIILDPDLAEVSVGFGHFGAQR